MIQEAGDYLRSQRFTLADTSYAGYLTFDKNKSLKDSGKASNKLDTRLDHLEINQMANSRGFC